MSDFAHPEILVSADWVQQHLNDPKVRIVETDEDPALYYMGHIPGAVEIGWHNQLNHPITRDYISVADFEDLCARSGIANDTTVVFYGDKSNWWACYAFWAFKLFGHQDCRVLNGGYKFWKDENTQDPKEWKRFGKRIRELTGGEDIDIVFEHPGRETFGASVFVTRKGGTITTCASTSGYMHEYDNRYLWMSLKRIIGSHFANYREAWETNRLIAKGKIHPTLSKVYSLEDTGQAAYDVHRNLHQGKVGVLCLAPEEGLGVRDEELRAKHIDAINRFRNI